MISLRTVANYQHYLSRLGHNGLFGAAALLLVLAVMLQGAWHNWDLPWGDGASYFARAQLVATEFRFPLFEWAPVHAAYYALFHFLLAAFSPFVIYFVYRITTLLLIGLLLFFLLRHLVSPLVAWLLAVYALVLLVNMTDAFTAHLFVLLPLLLACLAAFFCSPYRNGIILTCLLLAAVTRVELFLPFSLVLFLVIYEELFSKVVKSQRRLLYYMPFFLTIILLFVIISFRAVEREQYRSWIAFGQHYARTYRENVTIRDGNELPGWVEITEQSFADATSVSGAARANPLAFGRHLWWNLLRLPRAVTETLFPTVHWNRSQRQLVGLMVLLATLMSGRFLWQQRHEWLADRSGEQIKLWLILLATTAASLVAMLMVQPRPRHVVVLLPLFLLLVGLTIDLVIGKFGRQRQKAGAVPWLLLLLLFLLPTPFKADNGRFVIALVEQTTLLDQTYQQPYSLLTAPAFGLCAYIASDRCRPLEIYQIPREDRPFDQILVEQNVQVMVVTYWLEHNLPPNGRDYVQQLKRDPALIGWNHIDSIGPFELYARLP